MQTRKQIGSLNVLEVTGASGGPAIIIFHGFGANASDLYPLHQHIKAPAGTNWFFAEGLLQLAMLSDYSSRAWWPIDEAALQYALNHGTFRDFASFAPPGLVAAREAAAGMIRALRDERGFALDRITLGGFSQGAMLATDLTLRCHDLFHNQRPAGLAILSGTLLDEKVWSAFASDERFKGFQFFQSHGKSDPILDFVMARRLEKILRDSGWTGEFVEFPGGHEIPPPVLARLGQYLTRF